MTPRWMKLVGPAIALSLAPTIACGFIVDTDGLVGDASTGPANEDATADVAVVSEGGASDVDAGTDDATDAGAPDVLIGPDAPPSCEADAGFTCVPEAVAGWTGPFQLYVGNTTDAPSCGSVTRVVTANDSLAAVAPASCPACTCQPVTGASCGKFPLRGGDGLCGALGFTETPSPNTCLMRTPVTNTDANGFQSASLDFGASKMDGGSCQPTVAKPTPTKPSVTWNVEAVGCNNLAPTTPGCASGTVCAALPMPPFESKLCIRKDGDIAACPGAPYSQRRLFYQSTTDTRDCGTCTCGSPNAANCVGDAVFTNLSNCTGGSTAPPPGCMVRQQEYAYFKLNATPPTNATCPANGGAPLGTVTPASPVTVCCAN